MAAAESGRLDEDGPFSEMGYCEEEEEDGEYSDSSRENVGVGMSPESWGPPTAPGLLATSLEIGTQSWLRSDWRVEEESEEESGEGSEAEREDGAWPERSKEKEERNKIKEKTKQVQREDREKSRLGRGAREVEGAVRKTIVRRERKSADEDAGFGQILNKALGRWASLRLAPRELWIIFGLKFLSSYAYFSLMLIMTIHLTEEFHFSDSLAGWTYGMYGVMSTLFGLVCGWFIDYMGVKQSLAIGSLAGAVARAVLALTHSPKTVLFVLYTVLPFAECLGIPIMTIGIKRYTNAHNRTYAFSLFYSMMNLAALCAGPAVDFSRMVWASGVWLDLRPFGLGTTMHLSSLRLVILSGAFTTGLMFLIVSYSVREIDVDQHGNIRDFKPTSESPYVQTLQVLRNPVFWRLTLFTFLLVGVRLVFRHLDATFPKYLVRQFGDSAPYGLMYAINPFLIIFLVPLVGLMTRHIASFTMIQYGSFVAAASPFWMCFGPHYWCAIMFMIFLSIGEAVYSPRVYEYTMEVSGQGVEGLYSSLASAPLFSVQLLVGGMSGWLLTEFMPENGPKHGRAIWAIVGFTSMTSPILISVLKDHIKPPEEDRKNLPTIETSAMRVRDSDKQYYGTFEDAKLLARTNADSPQQAQGPRSGRPPLFPAACASLRGVRLEFNAD